MKFRGCDKVVSHFKDLINRGHTRSVKAKKNILGSLALKGTSILISFLLVRYTIDYVNASKYGIWLTISSIVGWFVFFDVGITQGLRNRFAEAKANGNDSLARVFVSTTYAVLAIIFSLVWIIFLFINKFLDWTRILNVSEDMGEELSVLAVIVFTYFCLQFVLRVITTVLTADQQPAKASLIDFLGQVASLLYILVLIKITEGSLVNLGLALCVSPLVVLFAANIFFFRGEYKNYSPSLTFVRLSEIRKLFNIGVIFFIIQIAAVVQFETANIIIARNFGSADVTSYNVVYKYFGLLSMIFVIFITPFWSASTEAYLKKDMDWIKNGIMRYNQLNIALFFLGIVMLLLSNQFYELWLPGGVVTVSFKLSLWGFVFFNVYMYGNKYVFFLNGINALRIQFWSSLVSPFVFIASSLFFIKYLDLGVYSLFIASIISNFNGAFLAPFQYHMIVNKRKKGIWIK